MAETLLIEMMVSSGVQMNANTPDTLLCFTVEGSSASEESMMVVALNKSLMFSLPGAHEIRRHR